MSEVIRISSDPMMTSRQVADLLGISEGRLRVWRVHGKGPRFARLGRRHGPIRYLRIEVERYLSECYARSA